ncbi:MAG: hypothetical protein WBE37_15405 [Bryobacteraceae bacterium]
MHALRKAPAANGWLVFSYRPTALFSLKNSRATSTVGKTLLIPTPYAVKMAFVDAALRHGLTNDPDQLVRELSAVGVRIGAPSYACVTGTIQRVRQETRAEDRKKDRRLPFYRTTIALREIVSYSGLLRVAFDREYGTDHLTEVLSRTAPAINYFGKRGSFMQYIGSEPRIALDPSFAKPIGAIAGSRPRQSQLATLDDFGPAATFDALNTFTPVEMKRGVHRRFVETAIPYRVRNYGFGFVHYAWLED